MTLGQCHPVPPALAGKPLVAAVKGLWPELSWSTVRRAIETRRVRVNGVVCIDESRRVRDGEAIELLDRPAAPPPGERDVRLVHIDEHLVVVDKPAGMQTLRRREEADWPEAKKAKQPTLQEVIERLLSRTIDPKRGRIVRAAAARALDVHRLDRDTSGLMLFARTPEAQRKLIALFKKHAIERTYRAIVHGHPIAQTIDTYLIRDRGDGRRGSVADPSAHPEARRAITHIRPIEQLGEYTLIECRLETGRTHQIRIHLSEIGHPLAGEKLYATPRPTDPPRQALHSSSLRFTHPMTHQELCFESPLPHDLATWMETL